MAPPHLPYEILSLIAKYVSEKREYGEYGPHVKIGPYALVNKAWQAVFEAEIYATVWVQSPSDSDTVFVGRKRDPRMKVGLTFDQLDKITSRSQPWRKARRDAIRHIKYWIAVPHWLADGVRERHGPEEDEQHTYDNSLRRENDEAFSRGTQALFQHLSLPSWAERPTLSRLSLVLQAQTLYADEENPEPGTHGFELNGFALASYRAALSKGTHLAPISCVRAVDFPEVRAPARRPLPGQQNANLGMQNGISLPAQVEILSACSDCDALVTAKLDGSYYMDGTIPLLTQKRNSFARVLHLLPHRIRALHLEWLDEISPDEYEELLQRQNTVNVPHDPLSRALHNVSMHLRELHIEQLDITSDFFLLSEDEHRSPVLWPNLEILQLTLIPMATLNGQPLLYTYCPDGEGGLPVPLTPWHEPGTDRLTYIDNYDNSSSIVPGFFDDLYASAGHAAQKMPRLRRLLLSWEQGDAHQLEIVSNGDHERVLQIYSIYGYLPGKKVLDAWHIPEEKMTLRHEVLETVFDCWPPLPLPYESAMDIS